MGEFRLSPEAEAELDGIWIGIARGSGSVDIATRGGVVLILHVVHGRRDIVALFGS